VVLKGMALSNDRPDVWAMTQDLVSFYKSTPFPDPMRRVIYLNLLDRMVQGGDVDQAERLVNEVLGWANERQDRSMEGWVLFAGSRLDYRRNDHYRARDRARDALKVFTAIDDKMKVAEVENHLAVVEFSDGNSNAALDHVRVALETANVPQIQANAEYIRGLVARKTNKLPEAAEHFRKSNELAGAAGMAPLALESGFNYGEALVASKQWSKAADVLARVAQIAASLQNAARERAAAALLSRTHGELRNFEAALQTANRTLQLTQELKFERFLPFDIFNVGYFNLLLNRPTEAISLFNKAKDRAPANEPGFSRDLHFHLGMAYLRIGEKGSAQDALVHAANHSRATKDWRKLMEASEAIATLAMERGDKGLAQKMLQAAMDAADEGNLREERKGLRRKMEELG
jgi:tetratricopeptide (TPR) repeat protein